MSFGDTSRDAMMLVYQSAVEQIQREKGSATCHAHHALSNGVQALLWGEIAKLRREAETAASWRSARWAFAGKVVAWGLSIIVTGGLSAWLFYLKIMAHLATVPKP